MTDRIPFEELHKKYSLSKFDIRHIETFSFPNYPVDIPRGIGSLNVLVGSPGVGKSSVAVYLAAREAFVGRPIVYFAWDLTPQYFFRLLARSGIDPLLLQNFFFVNEPEINIGDIKFMIADLPPESMVIIDYLQAIPIINSLPKGYPVDDEDCISYVANQVAQMAQNYNHIILVLSAQYSFSHIERIADSVVVATPLEGVSRNTGISLSVKKNYYRLAPLPSHPEIFLFPSLKKRGIDR